MRTASSVRLASHMNQISPASVELVQECDFNVTVAEVLLLWQKKCCINSQLIDWVSWQLRKQEVKMTSSLQFLTKFRRSCFVVM